MSERDDVSAGGQGEDEHGWSEKLCLTIQVKAAPPAAPAAPPMPTTVETAVEGNMSVGVEKRLADQPWWAAAARAMRAMAGQALVGKSCAHVRDEDDGQDAEGADEHGDLAAGVDASSRAS